MTLRRSAPVSIFVLVLPLVSCSGDAPQAPLGAGAGGDTAGSGASSGEGGGPASGAGGEPSVPSAEDDLTAAIAAAETDVPFTLLLGDEAGTFFEGSMGESTAMTSYESASTSKWVAATVILSLVEDGYLTLDSHPQDFVEWWTSDANDPRSAITLRQLLSFTSGLQPAAGSDELCVSTMAGTLETCVQAIYDAAAATAFTPGTEFVYGSHHLQVAGLMAIGARGVAEWKDVFDEFKAQTGLFATAAFDLPSAAKPRLAGGMHWTGQEYMAFLRSLFNADLLTDETRAELFSDHTPAGSVTMIHSPIELALNETWHYDLGNWRECAHEEWQDDCDELGRVSSPGAYGAYPFIDFSAGYYGILARQGALGTFADGLQLYRELDPLVEALAATRR
jgi:CubicO group peptidase (beta-lactamase class C family)